MCKYLKSFTIKLNKSCYISKKWLAAKFAYWRRKAQILKRQTYTVYLACKDPRTPWYAKCFALLIVGYAFSPVDLIPDFIPVLGYLDDLIIIPLGIALVIKMIPAEVLAACQEKGRTEMVETKSRNWIAAGIIIIIWVALAAWLILSLIRYFQSGIGLFHLSAFCSFIANSPPRIVLPFH